MSQAAWARRIVGAIAGSGVSDLVISPGSRSTPFVLAAAAHDSLRTHVVIDERSAGFFALGIAKRTGRPAALLCTSGTAGAHYYPAIIEAEHSFTPLLAITADRPPELLDCGAPQTIDQRALFGSHVRRFVDLGTADAHPDAARAAARKTAQAVAATTWPTPGPVHLNAPARKPLEPDPSATANVDDPPVPTVHTPALVAPATAVADLAAACRAARRGLIVAGPAPLAQIAAREPVAQLARATGFPLLAEAASQLRFGGPDGCDGFDALLRDPAFREAHAPDLIVQLGANPTSTGWREYQRRHRDCPRWIVAPHGWHDPHNSAAVHLAADVATTAAAIADALADADAGAGADATWADAFRPWTPPADPESAAVRTAVAALPPGALLCVGNSLPIRTVDAACRGADADVAVLSQRGVAGIDGLISGAAGATAAGATPVLLVLGDVSFAHDVGGLAAARDLRAPLAIVVLDNGGGRIFEQLPIAGAVDADTLERHWLTPPALDVEAAARTYGLPYQPFDARAVAAALERPGATVLHARISGDPP